MLGLVSANGLAGPEPTGTEPVVGGACEGCGWVFVGMPADIDSVARIAPPSEPGEPLVLTGRVLDPAGLPVSGIIVYAYQTNAAGVYPRGEASGKQSSIRHGALRGWARTGEDGQYQFSTIRPAGYPGTGIPQHIHMHVIEPGRCTYYIDDVVFTDDPRLTPAERERTRPGRGGTGIATPRRDDDGSWRVDRDIRLGAEIPGYPPRSEAPPTRPK